MSSTLRERLVGNATGIASLLVTGIWLAALLSGLDWWLPFMLFGYIVIVPIVGILFGDDEEEPELEEDATSPMQDADDESQRDALDTLRDRYARGELTDEQFERKLERLLDTETLENVEERAQAREKQPE
ncbi:MULTISPECIES: SHOCT domain-containing protein [unclassified Haladaptatus]|uniref:SHOCT domain-containing protein n=1 Tax=unclassified Haladaptatus TaxID=2622732 RepID=UPI0023E80C38|nr:MULTISPECIES: SHOCT domain-containing protein [unclassified Haladaptatus]